MDHDPWEYVYRVPRPAFIFSLARLAGDWFGDFFDDC